MSEKGGGVHFVSVLIPSRKLLDLCLDLFVKLFCKIRLSELMEDIFT